MVIIVRCRLLIAGGSDIPEAERAATMSLICEGESLTVTGWDTRSDEGVGTEIAADDGDGAGVGDCAKSESAAMSETRMHLVFIVIY